MGNQPGSVATFHEAIRRGHHGAVRYFINSGKHDINAKWDEQTAVFVAVLADKPDVLELLVGFPGVQLDVLCVIPRRDGVQFQWSALHEACRRGSTRMVELLLAAGADVNLVAHHRMAPLHIAAWHGRRDVVELLVKSGCDVNQVDRFQESALVIPICHGDTQIVAALLNAGCKLTGRSWGNTRKIRGKNEDDFRETLYGRHGPYTLLLLAIKYSWLHLGTLLLQHGFNTKKYQIHDILKNIKCNVGSINSEARTLIHCFLEAGYRFQAKDHCLLEDLIGQEQHGYDEGLIHELMSKSNQPHTLQEICRTTIRASVRVAQGQRSVLQPIHQLHLPKTLTDFLCLSAYDEAVSQAAQNAVLDDDLREPLYFAMPRKRTRIYHSPLSYLTRRYFRGR